MKFAQRITLLVMTLAIAGVAVNFGQSKAPRASQRGYIEQTVGSTMIKVTYHRPNTKGRTLWGDAKDALVPNGKVWRTGANEATVVEFTEDVMVNGKAIPAGKYGFYAIPTDGEWTLIFNKKWDQWGTVYDEKMDALRVMSKPMMADHSMESLAYVIKDVKADSATVVLAWGKARIPFMVKTVEKEEAEESDDMM